MKRYCLAVLLVLVLVSSAVAAETDITFDQWLKDFHSFALKRGITENTWNLAFGNVVEPDTTVLKRAAYQPEFVQEVWSYLDTRVNQLSIRRGLEMAEHHMATLALLERSMEVDRSILLAIWSMETNYGSVLKKRERLHYVPLALATLAWGDSKRSKFARQQLIAALEILQAGDINADDMLGSWAGAMGHTQFIPTSYLSYGLDMDGNGKRDIWNSIPDALATAANLLVKNGWRPGKTWGYEVVLPKGIGEYAEQTKTLAEWEQLGLKRPGQKAFPRPEEKAILKVLAGENGPGFLMLKNFFVIKRYNNSDKYALAVGLLADKIAGWDGMVQSWPRPVDSLTADEKIEMQQLLKAKGFYDGEVDGFLGKGSREAIREFEKQSGLTVNGMPTRTILDALNK